MFENSAANAANDEKYFSQRCRTLPIPATITPVSGYPSKLRIYLTNASPYWQAKCFFKGKTYTRSMRTMSKRLAIAAARDFFHATSAQIYGVNYVEQVRNEPSKHPFRSIAGHALAIETARCQRKELSKTGLRILTSRLNVRLLPHFGDMAVEDIGYTELANFIGLLSEEGTSSTTMAQYLVAIRKVLNYAQSLNLISQLPKFPQVKIRSNPRGSFTLNEYKLLLRAAKQWAGKRIEIKTTSKSQRGAGVKDKNLTMPFDMAWLIGFMVNSFIRPSDLKTLQHQHVEIIRGEHIYLRLNLARNEKTRHTHCDATTSRAHLYTSAGTCKTNRLRKTHRLSVYAASAQPHKGN